MLSPSVFQGACASPGRRTLLPITIPKKVPTHPKKVPGTRCCRVLPHISTSSRHMLLQLPAHTTLGAHVLDDDYPSKSCCTASAPQQHTATMPCSATAEASTPQLHHHHAPTQSLQPPAPLPLGCKQQLAQASCQCRQRYPAAYASSTGSGAPLLPPATTCMVASSATYMRTQLKRRQ